jgi:hypothetical protein
MSQLSIHDYDSIVKWSYTLAREWAIENLVPKGVISARKFERYKSEGNYLPRNFPRIPDEYFKRKATWKGWRDFLGYPDQSKKYLSYQQATFVVREYRIKNSQHFKAWKGRPANIPARPEYYYEEWKGWKDFLGEHYQVPKPRNFCKLTVSDVRIIKHQLNLGVSGSVLAKTFGVSEMQISRIRHGENWEEV